MANYTYADLPDRYNRYIIKPESKYRSGWYGFIFEFLSLKDIPLRDKSILEFSTLDRDGRATGLIFAITFKEFKEHMMSLEVGSTVKLKASETKYTVESVSEVGNSAILKHPTGYTLQLPQDEVEGLPEQEQFFEQVRRGSWSRLGIKWATDAKQWAFHIEGVGGLTSKNLRNIADYLDQLNALPKT